MLVYVLQNKINEKCYVGQTIYNTDKRISEHLSEARRGSDFLIHRAIRKYGIDSFDIKTIQCNSSKRADLDKLECDIINDLNSMVPNGYNLKSGGSRGKLSEVVCKRISKKLEGHEVTEEVRKKMRGPRKSFINAGSFVKGENNYRARSIILIHSDGFKEKFNCMSDACRKYDLHRAALSLVAKGRRKHHKRFKCNYLNQ